MNRPLGDQGHRRRAAAFTLVEVAVSVLLLAMLLGGVVLALRRTTTALTTQSLRNAAAQVAERRLESLLASLQEPNSQELHGQDQTDPRFSWTFSLTREAGDPTQPGLGLESSVIKAKVTVRAESDWASGEPLVELVRYFGTLQPREGHTVAVPYESEQPTPEPAWIEQLRQKLGREPTLDELLQEMVKRGELAPGQAQEMGVPVESPNPKTR